MKSRFGFYMLAAFAAVLMTAAAWTGGCLDARADTDNPSVASTTYDIMYVPVYGTWTTSAVAAKAVGAIKVPWPIRIVACHAQLGTATGTDANAAITLVYSNSTTTFPNLSTSSQAGVSTTGVNVTDETTITPKMKLTGTGSSLTNFFVTIFYKRR